MLATKEDMKMKRCSCLFALLVIAISGCADTTTGIRGERDKARDGVARADGAKAPALTAEDKAYLDGLVKDFLFDPADAKLVRVKAVGRSRLACVHVDDREGWFVPASGGRPARVHFTDGEYMPAPPEEEMTVLAADRSFRTRLRLPEKRRDDGKDADAVFRDVLWSATWAAGASDLILAAWLRQLGEDALAARALALERQGGGRPENEGAWRWEEESPCPAQYIFENMVCAYMVRADDEAWMHGQRLLRLFPKQAKKYGQTKSILDDLQRRKKNGTFGKAPPKEFPEGFAQWPVKEKVGYLIDALDEVGLLQGSRSDGVSLGNDRRVKALVEIGVPAVSALIDVLEKDGRLTRSVHFWTDHPQSQTVLSVREAALTAVASITRMGAIELQWRGNNFTSRGEAHAARVAKDLRHCWTKYGRLPFDELMMAVLTDSTIGPLMWREAAENLAQLAQQRAYDMLRESTAEGRGWPDADEGKFKEPTIAEAILAAMDRELKAHDTADHKDSAQRREIEDAYLSALGTLHDKRIAPELARRYRAATLIQMQRQLAMYAQWLGDPKPLKAFADMCRKGKAKLPAGREKAEDELYHVLRMLAGTGLSEADDALFAVADSKHPWQATARAVLASRHPDGYQSFLFHPFCLTILRKALDDDTPTGYTLRVRGRRLERKSKDVWGSKDIPAVLREPRTRKATAVERKHDGAAAKIALVAAGVPACHPLLKDADARLSRMKSVLDRFPRFREATGHEFAILRRPHSGDPDAPSVYDCLRQRLFIPVVGLLDRAATKNDVEAGRAIFHLGGKGKRQGLHLPAYAILKKNEKNKKRERVLVVQAEVGAGGTVTYGVITRRDIRVVSGKDVEKVKSIKDWKLESKKKPRSP